MSHHSNLPSRPIDPSKIYATGILNAAIVVIAAIELETLADHHDDLAARFRRDGDHEPADLMQARAAELRQLAERANAS